MKYSFTGSVTFCIAVFIFCMISTEGFSQYTFTGNGNWSDPSNWSGNVVPPNPVFDDVFIDGDCVMDVPTQSVGNITINNSLQIDGELQVDGQLENYNILNIENNGRLEINQWSFNYSTVTIYGEMHLEDNFENQGTINCESSSFTTANNSFPYPAIYNNATLHIEPWSNFDASLMTNSSVENHGFCNIPELSGFGSLTNYGYMEIQNCWGFGDIDNENHLTFWGGTNLGQIQNQGWMDFLGDVDFFALSNSGSVFFADDVYCFNPPFISLDSYSGSIQGFDVNYNTHMTLNHSDIEINGQNTFLQSFTCNNSNLRFRLTNPTDFDEAIFSEVPDFLNSTIIVSLHFNFSLNIGDTYPIIKGTLGSQGLSFDLPDLDNAHFGVFYNNSDSTIILEVLEGERRDRIGINTDAPLSELNVGNGNLFFSDLTGGIILEDSNGDCFKTTVTTVGALSTSSISCPTSQTDQLLLDASDNLILDNSDVLLSEVSKGIILRDQTGKCHALTIDNSGNMNVNFTACPNESQNTNAAIIAKENQDTEIKNGDLYVKSSNHGIILKDGNGSCYKSFIDGSGQLQFSLVNCKVY